ncbi:putative tRNA 2'-phosphotransferase [Porphyridium purpureum]|uniref:2'-phosphotransferase n=1 Tax=Porphyridium purpureum TaxID=35688 RepID=A0A5J4YHG7_PORPP|nr:putative tRNA 2'-phosphotransferase [Porphyridium purpureum]KAA8490698.1 putative tRNA 2'-phosphotransferase [Porphyridium purpureum]|eukprot:POR3356..scf255_21
MGDSTFTITNVATSSSDGVFLAPRSELRRELTRLSVLMNGAGFAAVDNSDSTRGAPLLVAQRFVQSLGVHKVSLWNSTCDAPRPLREICWISTGGTEPQTIFSPQNFVPDDASCFVFMTDGQVWSTEELARHASVTAHLPSLLIIFASGDNHLSCVSQFNVSVVMAHFTAAFTAAVLIVDAECSRLIAVKGDWLGDHLPQPPPLTDTLVLQDCPSVSASDLLDYPSRVYEPVDAGTIYLADGSLLDLQALLRVQDHFESLSQISQADIENITRAYFVLGRLEEWRILLNRWLVSLDQRVATQVQASSDDSSTGVYGLLRRLRLAANDSERESLSAQIRQAVATGASQERQAREQASRSVRGPRALVNAALDTALALSISGMSAMSLGRLSNRATRAGTIDRNAIAELVSLDASGAPQEEDMILYEEGPVALCFKAMSDTEHNTSDFALNQALRVGQYPANAVIEPLLVALEFADGIERSDTSPLTRERLSVCLPIVPLANEHNRRVVFERLCLVFMSGLSMQHVWLVALSSILRTLETQEWAAAGTTPTGRLLEWFAVQIMEHVILPEGSRLSPDASRPINEALVAILRSEVLTVHSSVEEASVILRLMHRFPTRAAFSNATLRQSMLARIAVAVPQMHRNWLQNNRADVWADQGATSLSALLSSICDTRVDARGAHISIAGTSRLVASLEPLLPPHALQAVIAFANPLAISIEDLVVPGLSLVVRATLDCITSPDISSYEAVQLVRSYTNDVAAEMNVNTAGIVTSEQALDTIRSDLAWARVPLEPMPPFATPFGPSTLWFYTSDGTVVDMTQGFEMIANESRSDMVLRLTDHVRGARGRLMARYYGSSPTGSFIAGTTAVPLYKEMSKEYQQTGSAEDLSNWEFTSSFVHRVVQRLVGRSGPSAGNVYAETLERYVAMLVPSLRDSIARHACVDVAAEPQPLPLLRRVELELGDSSPDMLGDALEAVWIPQDDLRLIETLTRVHQLREADRIAALRRRRRPDGTDVDEVSADAQAKRGAGAGGNRSTRLDVERFQRSMTWYLRHRAATRPDGYITVDALLDALDFPAATADSVLQAAAADEKTRFSVIEEDGLLLVRANQGHTITSVDPEQLLTPIYDPDDVPVCAHGTYDDSLLNILRSGGLNRMQRHAIQMAVGLPDDPEVRSGIRRGVDVVIYIDVARAIRHGLRFYRSQNNVICCPGPIPVDCFIRVIRLSNGACVNLDEIRRNAGI